MTPKLTDQEYNRFIQTVVEVYYANTDWRYGQTMFNVLDEEYPELANEIRGTANDPFYNNDRIEACINYIYQ